MNDLQFIRFADLKLEKYIDGGTSGRVFKGTLLTTGETVAVKLLKDDSESQEEWTSEILILYRTQHNNVVKVKGYSQDTFGQYLIILEYAEGGDLQTFCKKNQLNWQKKYDIIVQMVQAINYLHQNKILHRDVKSSNFVVSKLDDFEVVKVCDFGLSKLRYLMSEDDTRLAGTLNYIAPELILDGERPTFASDIYSLAITIFEVISGTVPIRQKMFKGHRPSFPYGCPAILVDVVKKCWTNSPQERLTSRQLLTLLTKPISLQEDVLTMQNLTLMPILNIYTISDIITSLDLLQTKIHKYDFQEFKDSLLTICMNREDMYKSEKISEQFELIEKYIRQVAPNNIDIELQSLKIIQNKKVEMKFATTLLTARNAELFVCTCKKDESNNYCFDENIIEKSTFDKRLTEEDLSREILLCWIQTEYLNHERKVDDPHCVLPRYVVSCRKRNNPDVQSLEDNSIMSSKEATLTNNEQNVVPTTGK